MQSLRSKAQPGAAEPRRTRHEFFGVKPKSCGWSGSGTQWSGTEWEHDEACTNNNNLLDIKTPTGYFYFNNYLIIYKFKLSIKPRQSLVVYLKDWKQNDPNPAVLFPILRLKALSISIFKANFRNRYEETIGYS